MSTEPLYRLIYLSSAKVAFPPDKIEDLLTKARTRNEADGISGLLVYHDGNFFQVLEGPETAVKATFERISRDTEHDGMLMLHSEIVLDRVFPDWTMGYARPEELSKEAANTVVEVKTMAELGADTIRDDARVDRLLERFLASFRAL